MEAFARVRNSLPGTSLVIAGGKGWQWQPVFGAVEALGLGDDVHFPGYVPYEEQPLWYNAATVFVYPSLYEGFGFPVLEAMACGTPVISADNSSLPEVAGEAALYFQASEREQLATAIVDLMVDEQRREQLRQLGLARAGLFSWQRAAAETAAVYSDL